MIHSWTRQSNTPALLETAKSRVNYRMLFGMGVVSRRSHVMQMRLLLHSPERQLGLTIATRAKRRIRQKGSSSKSSNGM